MSPLSKRDSTFGSDIASMGSAIAKALEGKTQTAKPEKNLESTIAEAIEEMAGSKKNEDNVKMLTALLGQKSIVQELTEGGLTVKDILTMDREDKLLLKETLDKEIERRREAEESAINLKREDRSNEFSMQQQMFGMLMEVFKAQSAHQDSVMQSEIRELKEQLRSMRESATNSTKEPDPVTKTLQESQASLLRLALEKLVQPPAETDPMQSFRENLSHIGELQEMFGRPASSSLELELKKIELEDRWRREEAEIRREVEQAKMANIGQFLGQIQNLLPAVLEHLGQRSNAAENPMEEEDSVICPDCGTEYPIELEECPQCQDMEPPESEEEGHDEAEGA
jgi:hypothetical protein